MAVKVKSGLGGGTYVESRPEKELVKEEASTQNMRRPLVTQLVKGIEGRVIEYFTYNLPSTKVYVEKNTYVI